MFLYKLFSQTTKSKYLFHFLLRKLQPDLILDIGSRDGADALEFRKAAPNARIIAFEAHPHLAAKMRSDPELERNHITVEGCAVGAASGTASFRVFNEERGTGSLLPRVGAETKQEFTVPVRRLDELEQVKGYRRVALWIDVEGCCYDALEGAASLLDSVILIHAEVESQAYWTGQRLVSDVRRFLAQHGFAPVYERSKRGKAQSNMIFLRRQTAHQIGTMKDVLWFDVSQGMRRLPRPQHGRS